MAGLNLDSLKNLRSSSNKPKTVSLDTASPTAKTPTEAVVHAVEKAPVVATKTKKLSLMSLKKTGGTSAISSKAVIETPAPIVQSRKEEDKTLPKISLSQEIRAPKEEIILMNTTESEIPESLIEISNTREETSIFSNSTESVSLSIEGIESQGKTAEITEETCMKEFFPNLKSVGKISLCEDMDIISETIPTLAVENSLETEMKNEIISAITPRESTLEEKSHIQASKVILEENTDQEHVAEVKTGLSEQRRAGFRFLTKQKTKILTGVGVLVSISVIAMVSNSFLWNLAPTGKSNIQEVMEESNIVSSREAIVPLAGVPAGEIVANSSWEVVSPENASNASYEVGRDYSVTKNNKKNTKTKNPGNRE